MEGPGHVPPTHGVHGLELIPPPRGAHREQQGYARGRRESLLGVILIMVNMVLGITVVALGVRGSIDYTFLRVLAISLN